jgi:hypothetical protein
LILSNVFSDNATLADVVKINLYEIPCCSQISPGTLPAESKTIGFVLAVPNEELVKVGEGVVVPARYV